MAIALPLLILPHWRDYRSIGLFRAMWEPKIRSWWVIMASSLATYIHQSIEFYLAICLIGAALVLSYRMTAWQRFLGWIFIAMAGLNLGFLLALQKISSVASNLNALSGSQHLLGWAMVLTLLLWGGDGILRRIGILSSIPNDHRFDTVEPSP